MTKEEQDLLEQAALGGGVLEIPLKDASSPALLSLISAGYLKAGTEDPSANTVRYILRPGIARSLTSRLSESLDQALHETPLDHKVPQ